MRPETLFAPPSARWDAEWAVRPVGRGTAAGWFARWHYSGTRNAGSVDWGIFAPDLLAVVAVGESSNVSGLAGRYDLGRWRGNKEITRVAVHGDAPPNAASRTVAAVCRFLAGGGLEWVFSYADTGQGHHGGIYQALNAVYVGQTKPCGGYLLDGVPTHPRQIVHLFGTRAAGTAERLASAQGRTLQKVAGMNSAKHTYILPIGPPSSRSAIRRHLRAWAKPYPTRAT